MTSIYLKCDGCGTVYDRLPDPIEPATYHFSNAPALRRDAEVLGWTSQASAHGDNTTDWCPACSEAKREACS